MHLMTRCYPRPAWDIILYTLLAFYCCFSILNSSNSESCVTSKFLGKEFCLLTHRNQSQSVGSNHYHLDPNYLEQYLTQRICSVNSSAIPFRNNAH